MIRNVILAIILAVQVGIWFIVDSPLDQTPARSDAVEKNRLEDIPVDDIGVVEVLGSGGASLTLVRRSSADGLGGTTWVVDDLFGFPAIQSKVTGALEELRGLSRSEFRTDKKFMHEDFEVDDLKGQKIRFFTGDRKALASMIVGKRDIQGVQGTFVRMQGDERVFVAPSQLIGTAFTTEPYSWVNRTMMDTDPQQVLTVRGSCHRIEVEGQQPQKDAEGRYKIPAEYRNVRYVYDRVDPSADGADPTWRVAEPAGLESLVLADLQIKNMVSSILNMRMNSIIAPAAGPEHGLDEDEGVACRVVCRFRTGESETSRTIIIGNEFDPAPLPNGRPQPKLRYAQVRHPGEPISQSFVFSVQNSLQNYYLREPSMFVVRSPQPAPAPKKDGEKKDGDPPR